MDTSRLRIALQKSGRLSQDSLALLAACGLKIRTPDQQLLAHVENLPVDIFRVRDDDIPGLVIDGACDVGIVGGNVLEEACLERELAGIGGEVEILAQLDFGICRLALAAPKELGIESIRCLGGKRIATTYPRLLARYLKLQNVDARVVTLQGSVEVAPRAGLADAICDLVESGATLEANGLVEADTIYRSSALLIRRKNLAEADKLALVAKLLPRISGVMQAKESKYIMLHAPTSRLAEVIELLPGAEHPTVLPLAGDASHVAVHAVSSETVFWETMEGLKALGASSILVLPIEKMLA
jgi:ATP phosphoribosyltransferase